MYPLTTVITLRIRILQQLQSNYKSTNIDQLFHAHSVFIDVEDAYSITISTSIGRRTIDHREVRSHHHDVATPILTRMQERYTNGFAEIFTSLGLFDEL